MWRVPEKGWALENLMIGRRIYYFGFSCQQA
jgi:hypothetical protein